MSRTLVAFHDNIKNIKCEQTVRTSKKKCNLEFIFPKVYRIDCARTTTETWKGLRFDFVYWVPSVVLLTFFFSVVRPRFPFSSRLSLDSPTPYGQVVRLLQRSVFTNFISFLWGIKSSRRRPRREERGSECASATLREGEVSPRPNRPSRTCVSPPPVGV